MDRVRDWRGTDTVCVECGNPIQPTDDKTTVQQDPYHTACWDRKTRKPVADAACAHCGQNVQGLAVREGERLLHVDCYRRYKRQASPARPPRRPKSN